MPKAFVSPLRYIVLVLVVLLWGAGSPAHAQAPKDGSVLEDRFVRFQAKRGLDLLYDMQFEKAERLFSQVDRRYPDHPIGPFLNALNTWWKILLDLSDTSHDETFYKEMDEVIARADKLLNKDPDNFDAMFFKGAALGFRGRLRSNRRDWLKSASDGKRAMDYVLAVAEKDPSNHDYIFGKGLYDYFADVMPDKYPFAKPLMVFFPKGNRARGLAALKRTAEQGYYIKTEAVYFLLQIYYIFEEDYEQSVKYVSWLRREHPDNAFFHAFEGRVYARWGRWDKARPIFREVLNRFQKKWPGYEPAIGEQALYYIARDHMNERSYKEALSYLLKLEALTARHQRDSYFKVLGRLRQGMSYDALGRRNLAKLRYEEVLRMDDWAGAHERARRYLQRPYPG